MFDRLAQIVVPGGALLRSWTLAGGISAEMTALEVQYPDGALHKIIVRRPGERALKCNPHAAEDEFTLLQLTRGLGLATPTPYYFDQSGTIFADPYLVIEYIDGQPEFAPVRQADFTLQLAEHLAKIHGAAYSDQEVAFLPKHAHGCTETSTAQPNTDAALDTRGIRAVLRAAEPLPQRNAPALLHGDYWPGNILWRDGKLVAVVDWEDAIIGDPLIDLAISRLDILWIFGTDAMQSFTRHYQSLMKLDYTNLPFQDLCAALRLARLAGTDLAAWAGFFEPYGRHDITEHTLRQHFQFFVAQAFEQLALQ